MSRENLNETLLKDPLRELTRNKRKYLLLSSVIAIAVTKAGFIPTKINALGIEFQQSEQEKLLMFISLVVLYFAISFIVYASTDFLSWVNDIHEAKKDLIRQEYEGVESFEKFRKSCADKELDSAIDELERELKIREQYTGVASGWLSKLLIRSFTPTALIRGFLDFVLPILVSIYAIDWTALIRFFT